MIWTDEGTTFASIDDAILIGAPLVSRICGGFTSLLFLLALLGLVQSLVTM